MAFKETTPFKLLVVGDKGVGKTAFVRALSGYDFFCSRIQGADLYPLLLANTTCLFLDTAGQEKYTLVNERHYAGTDIAVIVFDVTRAESFRGVRQWYDNILRLCGNIPILLVGNKIDMFPLRRILTSDVARHWKSVPYSEVSAATHTNIPRFRTFLTFLIDYLSDRRARI